MGTRLALVLLAAALIAVGAVSFAGGDPQRVAVGPEAPRDTPPVVRVRHAAAPPRTGAPPEVVRAAKEWPLPHHDYANTRATTDARIDAGNVSRLGIAWTRKLDVHSHWGAAASAPIIAGGRVFFQDLRSDVYAYALADGRPLWHAAVGEKAFGPNGPSIGWGKVFAQDGSNGLRAFDLRSGRPLWRAPLDGPTGAQQPVPYGGYVYTGIGSGGENETARDTLRMHLLDNGSSGWIYGLRQDDGGVVWGFRTVEKGFWGHPELNSGGGIWYSPAVDTATGTTYWSTGNPAPGPGLKDWPNASSRPGPNLYTNTVLAFGGRDGAMRWYQQVAPHDLLHHDVQNPPILVRAGGRDLVVASGKTGRVYAMDRRTGARLWTTAVGIHRNDDLTALPADGRPVDIWPGFWGGIESPGAAADGTLYFQVVDCPTPYTATAWDSPDTAQTVQRHEGRTPLDQGTSRMVAIDAATGRIKWQRRFGQIGFGGATVVNDLVFTSTYDGTMTALRRKDGTIAWQGHAPAGIIAWPAVSGDSIVWPAGLGRDPTLVTLRVGARRRASLPVTRVQGAR